MSGRFAGWNAVINDGAAGAGCAASDIFARKGAILAIVDIQEKAGLASDKASLVNGGVPFVDTEMPVEP